MAVKEFLKKVKKISNKGFNSIAIVIMLGVFLFLKSLIFYYTTVALTRDLQIQTIIGSIAFSLLFVSLLCMLPNRGRIIISLISMFIISTLLFGDNLYYLFANNVLSVAQITNVQYGGEILGALPVLLKKIQVLYFLDIFIIILLIITRFLKIEKKEKKNKKELIKKYGIGLVCIIVFGMVFGHYVENGKLKPYNRDFQIREGTIFGYHIADIQNAILIKQQTKYKNYDSMMEDYNRLKKEYEEKYGQEQYEFEGIAKGKNVIVIQLESVQEFVLNKEINGTMITPNLNKFFDENIRFANLNQQSYSTTADCEHTSMNSLYPMENGMVFAKYFSNTYDDIYKMYAKGGYHTSYMHGNYPYFWNRGNVYGRLDLSSLELKEDFEDLSENINGDLSDELLYRQAISKLKSYENPYFSYITAASSHNPFTLEGLHDRSKVSVDVGKYKDTYFGNYIEAVNYADYAFGIFIDKLKEEGMYDDTVIFVHGDHNGVTMYDEELLDFLRSFNPNLTDVDIKLNYPRCVGGMRIPGVKNLVIEKQLSKLDIKPTLTYLSGIEDGFSLGTNIFASKDFVCLNNDKIITDEYYYDDNWYYIETGEEVDLETIDEEIKKKLEDYYRYMKTELDISGSIIVNDLLR